MLFSEYLSVIDNKEKLLFEVSDTIWDNPETMFEERIAAELLMKILEENGFRVTRNIADIPTAFTATCEAGVRKSTAEDHDAYE